MDHIAEDVYEYPGVTHTGPILLDRILEQMPWNGNAQDASRFKKNKGGSDEKITVVIHYRSPRLLHFILVGEKYLTIEFSPSCQSLSRTRLKCRTFRHSDIMGVPCTKEKQVIDPK